MDFVICDKNELVSWYVNSFISLKDNANSLSTEALTKVDEVLTLP